MKRLTIVLLALGLVGANVGAVAAQALDGTLKKIKSTGVIRVGYRESSPPFSFMGPEGKPVGYSIDLCDRVARAVQAELKLANLKVQYVPVTVSNRMDLVASGAVDIECGSSTASLSRHERVDFSSLIFVDGGAYLVSRGAGIQGITDFAGKKIGVITGTTTARGPGGPAAEWRHRHHRAHHGPRQGFSRAPGGRDRRLRVRPDHPGRPAHPGERG